MIPHGPDGTTFEKGTNIKLKPEVINSGIAFMFETLYMLKINKNIDVLLDKDYTDCWEKFLIYFNF